jgi:hypothetical protein
MSEATSPSQPRPYRAYLLRLWQADGGDDRPEWHASLEDPHTGERRGFADLARLFEFLEEQTDDSPRPSA